MASRKLFISSYYYDLLLLLLILLLLLLATMQPVLPNFKYYLESSLVNATSFSTYLDVDVSSTLLFNAHISQTVQKAPSTLYMLMGALKGASCQLNVVLFLVFAYLY